MVTNGKSRGATSRLLLMLLLCCTLALGLGAAAPALALTLGGQVALDTNGNGIIDAADSPLAGISVSVQPAAGGVAASTTTGSDGRYSFPGLSANTYLVSVGSASGALNETATAFTVPLTADRNDVNFLFVVPGLIGGRVVSDTNGNGIADATEQGIPNVQITLQRLDQIGNFVTVTTATTSPDGSFFFPLQPAGTYRVVASDPAGHLSTGANAGPMGTGTVVDSNSIRIILNGSQAAAGLAFLDRPLTPGGGTGGAISGFVYDDTNRNNVVDPPADQPVPNAVVEQLDASQNLLARTMTDASGRYSFTSVASGATYVIRVIPPAGSVLRRVAPTSPATAFGTSGILITGFNTGTTYANNNFLLGPSNVVSPGTPGQANAISGKVFNDLNGNGQVNGGEPGLAGATLTLVSETGVSFGSQTTDASGDFIFVNLPAGTYTLTETDPAGFFSTGVQPGIGGTSLTLNSIRITLVGTSSLSSGHIFLDATSGFPPPGQTPGTISGTVYRDVNLNGQLDFGDLPQANVQVILQTSGGGFLAQAFTNVSGTYTFTNLQPGTYRVVEVDPPNTFSVNAFPGTGGVFIDVNTIQVTLLAGGQSINNNFLDRATGVGSFVGSISGSVFRDTNQNGVIDGFDVPLAGVLVQLFTQTGTPVNQTTTNASGAYSFTNLPPGFYLVVEQDPANHTSVNAFPGTNGSFVNVHTLLVSVVAGVNSGNNNFLDRLAPGSGTGTIMGGVFRDVNFNGFIDPADPVIPGVTVRLFDANGNFIRETTTAAGGAFTFSNLVPGVYQVFEVNPANHTSVDAFPGPNGVRLNADTFRVTVFAGVTSADNNYLDRQTAVGGTFGSISGGVFRDVNLSGFIDTGDVPIQGVTVNLFTSSGTFLQSATTAANGGFSFTNLPPGFYQVVEQDPANHTSVNAFAGTNGVVLNNNTIQVNVVAGVNAANHNFLDRLIGSPGGGGPNTISGFAIRDLNVNGQANNEPGLAGMFITLQDQFGQTVGTVQTDGTGAFSFSGLGSGTYTLTASPPFPLSSTNAIPGQNGVRLSANSIRVTTGFGLTQYQGQLFLAGP